jgi:hypothetical protein
MLKFMKRAIIIAMILLCSISIASAQKHTLLVYGNLDARGYKSSNAVKNNSFSLTPGIGYQWDDHWTGGINLAFNTSKMGSLEEKSTAFGAGPFIRYAYPLSDIFAVYGQLNANYLSGKTAGLQSNGFETKLFPAIGINLKNGFALNFNFESLDFASNKFKGSNSTTNYGISFGSGAGFGISKNFGL